MSLLDRIEAELPPRLAELFGLEVRLERIGPRLVVRGPGSTVLIDAGGSVEGEDLFAEQVALAVTMIAAGTDGPFANARIDPPRAAKFLATLEERLRGEVATVPTLRGAQTKRYGDVLLIWAETGHGVVHASGYGTGDGALWDRVKSVVAVTAAETL